MPLTPHRRCGRGVLVAIVLAIGCRADRAPAATRASVVLILDGATTIATASVRHRSESGTHDLVVDELVHPTLGSIAIDVARTPSAVSGALIIDGRRCAVVEAVVSAGEVGGMSYQGFVGTCVVDHRRHEFIVGVSQDE